MPNHIHGIIFTVGVLLVGARTTEVDSLKQAEQIAKILDAKTESTGDYLPF